METVAFEKNIDLLRRAVQTLQSGDLDACVELLTADFIANLPGLPGPLHGREIWKSGAQAMREGFPDLRIDVEDIFGAGDKVAVRLLFQGTHDGPFQGVPPTHRRVAFTSIEIYRLVGDRIAEEWVSPDLMGLMGQISGPASP
ncbi:ester cyclase [Actinoplanes sp. NPDC051411]|uniref:ester cyclase n=1 Tax=Actinoplanes sp. NPDC051411 TaxID=3155522 RepID=UPI0034486834